MHLCSLMQHLWFPIFLIRSSSSYTYEHNNLSNLFYLSKLGIFVPNNNHQIFIYVKTEITTNSSHLRSHPWKTLSELILDVTNSNEIWYDLYNPNFYSVVILLSQPIEIFLKNILKYKLIYSILPLVVPSLSSLN